MKSATSRRVSLRGHVRVFFSLLMLLLSAVASARDFDFGFDNVAARARTLAAHAYKDPSSSLSDPLSGLQFQQYAQIQYKNDHALWRVDKLPFQLSFFHEGMQYDTPVKVHLIDAHGIKDAAFNPGDFDYGSNHFSVDDLKDLQFAGLRVQAPINTKDRYDQILVFQGASYLRAIGKGQRFGLSARGLGIDTGLASGEEFPQFTEFWIARPRNNDKSMVIYALLNSARATGAYRFTLRPGVTTVTDVKARIFLRDNVGKLELAPLTGMFLFGPNQPSPIANYRPALHDSEGLSVHTGDDHWIWRPLVDPGKLLISSFATTNPKGFGLMQRSHDFRDYQDLDDRYDLRPSGWVEVKGNWGKGRVELVEIPTPDETNDNIVAYWVPDQQPKTGQPYDYEYSIHWENAQQTLPDQLAHVTQTRYSLGTVKQANLIRRIDGSSEFVLDFAGLALDQLPPNAPVQAVVEVDPRLSLLETRVTRNDAVGGWRVQLRLRSKDGNPIDAPVELKAYLHNGNTTLSETWSYLLPGLPAAH